MKQLFIYTKYYSHTNRFKQMIFDGCIDTHKIQKAFKSITTANTKPAKLLFMKMYNQFYKDYTDSDFYATVFPPDVQSALRIMQHIITLNEQQFIQQFQIETSKQIEVFFRCFNDIRVNNYELLKGKIAISKLVDLISINLIFTELFKFQNIEEQLLCDLLDGAENRLQHIQIDYKIAIFKNINTNNLQKRQITFTNRSNIEQFLALLNDDQTYQVIIRGQQYNNFDSIRISYLNYINQSDVNDITLQLKYPELLVSVTLDNVQLENINKCVNLQNLCTTNHTYTLESINKMIQIQRFKSKNDNYKKTSVCMLQQLFETNKLQYVYIEYGENIVNELVMKQNTQYLRFFYHLSRDEILISMDLSLFPQRLQFIYNFYNDDGYVKDRSEIQLLGGQNKINKLKRQLISL